MRAARFESLSGDGDAVAGLGEGVAGCCPRAVVNVIARKNAPKPERIVCLSAWFGTGRTSTLIFGNITNSHQLLASPPRADSNSSR
jgi:hypothetical protein